MKKLINFTRRIIIAIIDFGFFSIIIKKSKEEYEEEAVIINIENTTNSKIERFYLFDAAKVLTANYRGGKWDTSGNLLIDGIKLSSGTNKCTYQQLLTIISYSELFVRKGELQIISGSAAQIVDIFTVHELASDGSLYTYPIKPFISPHDHAMKITPLNFTKPSQGFLCKIDCLTSFIFNTIYPAVNFQLKLLPIKLRDKKETIRTLSIKKVAIIIISGIIVLLKFHFIKW